MKSSTILLVDHDPENIRTLSEILSEAGHKVYSTQKSLEALTILKSQEYNLVLTEINMPEMNGIDLFKLIKKKWKNSIPVIFTSSQVDVQTTFLAIKEGARDLIVKPFDKKAILDSVQYVLDNPATPKTAELEEHYKDKICAQPDGEPLQKSVADLKMLDEITKALDGANDVNDVCWTVLNMVQQLLEANRIAMVVLDNERKKTAFLTSYGDDFGVKNELVSIDVKIQEWVLQHKSELVIGDLEKDYKYAGLAKSDQTKGSLLAVPIKVKEDMLGHMILFKNVPGYFNKEMVSFMIILGRLTATAINNVELTVEIKKYLNGTIRALIAAVEAKDRYALGHAARVGRYALMMAKELNLTREEIRQLEYLALLHDIGMIGVPEVVLQQKGRLSVDEWEILKKHAEIGANIVQTIEFIKNGETVIRHHHEWFNGKGYPGGLKGEEIPFFSRVIAVAEAFDSMTGVTCYREPVTVEKAIEELKSCSGTQFDPRLVELFIDVYNKERAEE